MTKQLTVVGGGIAGLSAAYHACEIFPFPIKVSVLEGADYWGGKIKTERENGFVIEGGPDTFIATKPWALQLCRDLGIEDNLFGTNPDQKKTYILNEGQLHPLPGGLTMMIPTDIGGMLNTELLTWQAKIRMGLDFVIPAQPTNGDESLGAFVTRRLGREAYERLVEPLMGGIYAGDGDKLSLQATFPYLKELEIEKGGLIKGALSLRRERARNGRTPTSGSRSLFLTPRKGLAEIVEALVRDLEQKNADLLLDAPVSNVQNLDNGYRLELNDGQIIETDLLILATPAYISGDLIKNFAPSLTRELKAIDYVSTATVSLVYDENEVPRPLDGYGYVIPRREDRTALACTWTSTKFPHRAPDGFALLRVFIGRSGQEQQIDWSQEGLLDIARLELKTTLGITAEPSFWRSYIWIRAMPQYNVGHTSRIDRIDKGLRHFPNLALAGNGYQGIGIPDCINSGKMAVEKVLQQAQNSG